MQADWGQLSNFNVDNDAGHTFTFQKNNEGSPITFNVEMIPTACSCTSWQPCGCEKDKDGIYLTQYDCEHDNNHYNTCCSQVNAPAQAIPTAAPPLVVITPSPPSTPPPPLPPQEEEGETY